jgi:hypothetical protein
MLQTVSYVVCGETFTNLLLPFILFTHRSAATYDT